MQFDSLEFAIFLPVVFLLYWLIGPKRNAAQNFLLLGASYFFYGWWDWRFLALILITTIVNFALCMEATKRRLSTAITP